MKYILPLLCAALLLMSFGRKNVCRFPIDNASRIKNDGIIGTWKWKEDTNKANFFEVSRCAPYSSPAYHVKFWDRGGTNPTFEANVHFSKVGDATFINVPYWEGLSSQFRGYFFLKIINANKGFTDITAAVVNDDQLGRMDQAGLKQRIAARVNDPTFYSDTIHIYTFVITSGIGQ